MRVCVTPGNVTRTPSQLEKLAPESFVVYSIFPIFVRLLVQERSSGSSQRQSHQCHQSHQKHQRLVFFLARNFHFSHFCIFRLSLAPVKNHIKNSSDLRFRAPVFLSPSSQLSQLAPRTFCFSIQGWLSIRMCMYVTNWNWGNCDEYTGCELVEQSKRRNKPLKKNLQPREKLVRKLQLGPVTLALIADVIMGLQAQAAAQHYERKQT